MFNKEIKKDIESLKRGVSYLYKQESPIFHEYRISKIEAQLRALMDHLEIKFEDPKHRVVKK